jgi:hypothetical protein
MKYSTRIKAYIYIVGFKYHIDKTIYPSGRGNKEAIDDLNLTHKRLKRVFKPEHAKFMKCHPDIFRCQTIKIKKKSLAPLINTNLYVEKFCGGFSLAFCKNQIFQV